MCLQRRKEESKKKRKKGERSEVTFLSFFTFFLFFPWEIPREIHRHRVFMRETTARDVTVIYYAYPRIHTRRYSGCSKTPVYQCDGQTAAHIHATGARTRSCDNGQGWWAREDDFSRLETSRVASNLVDKNCCKKRISLWKIMEGGEEKISRKFVWKKSLKRFSELCSGFLSLTFGTQNCYILQEDKRCFVNLKDFASYEYHEIIFHRSSYEIIEMKQYLSRKG